MWWRIGTASTIAVLLLLITLVQGTILNVLIAIFMSIVYGLQRLFGGKPIPEYACRTCRYDLRGNPDATVCAECGTQVPDPEPAVCTNCWYDMRGNPDGERCPECGARAA